MERINSKHSDSIEVEDPDEEVLATPLDDSGDEATLSTSAAAFRKSQVSTSPEF